jgi:hypothetical protein
MSPDFSHHFNQFNVDIPESGGPLLIFGSGGTKVRFTPVSISQFRMEVDTNGDDIFEINDLHLWTQFAGVIFKFEKAIGTDGYDEGNSVSATSGLFWGHNTDFVLCSRNCIMSPDFFLRRSVMAEKL